MCIKELEEAVSNIQEDIYESTGGALYLNVVLKSNGYMQAVEFLGMQIWSDEEYKEGEPLESSLRKAVNVELDKLKVIRV